MEFAVSARPECIASIDLVALVMLVTFLIGSQQQWFGIQKYYASVDFQQ